jgi:non-ribosomal peptide synthetase component F
MRDISKYIENLSPKQRALFELLRKEQAQEERVAAFKPTIPRAGAAEWYPLSFAQQRLWFLDQLEPDNSFYSIPLAVRLRGTLDMDALEGSIREITRRHEVLRAAFNALGGQPVQVIRPANAERLPLVNLRHLPEQEREQEARSIADAEARRPFNLARGWPLRSSVLRLDEQEHVLLVTMHHIVSDGWSVGILMKEMSLLYDAFSRGMASPLADLTIQYTDYAVWQRARLQAAVWEEQLDYWRKHLGDAPKKLELPVRSPTAQTFRAGRGYVEWPKAVAEKLKSLSQREGATLFMTLLAAFQTLLHRYSGQDDIIVGTPTAGRNHAELEPLIGCFVKTLVMRADLSGNPTFRELLGRVRNTTLGAFAHQDVPFEKLVEELQPERDVQRTPIFRVWFVLQNAPLPPLELRGLTISPIWVSPDTSKFDLMLSMEEEADGLLIGILRYNSDLFDEETIAQMLRHFNVLLESVAEHPEWRLLDIPLVREAQRTPAAQASAARSENETESQFNF